MRKFLINGFGKYKEIDPICPFCNSHNTVDNGYYSYECRILKRLGLDIRNGHYQCKDCKKTWSTPYKPAKEFVNHVKRLLKETSFKLFTNGLSFGEISSYVEEHYGLPFSEETARQYYMQICKEHKNQKVLSSSGFFNVDCQHLKLNGKKVYRLTITDPIHNNCIVDIRIRAETVEEIVDRIRLYLLPYEKKGFIVDGKIGLDAALEKEFGVPVQLCITHFQSLIVKDYINFYGKNLNLQQLRNMYLQLSILADHDVEVQFLNKKLDELDNFKKRIICLDKKLKEVSIKREEKRLLKEFYDFRRSLKKYRRKQKNYLIPRTEEEIDQKIEIAKKFIVEKQEIKRLKILIEKKENLTHFLRVNGMPSTNNGVEHYYSKSLTKTQKKRFRSHNAVDLRITAAKAINNGWTTVSVTLISILRQVAYLLCLFGKPT